MPVRDVALLEVLYGTGIRASEAAGLRLGTVPAQRALRVMGKGRKNALCCWASRRFGPWTPGLKSVRSQDSGKTKDACSCREQVDPWIATVGVQDPCRRGRGSHHASAPFASRLCDRPASRRGRSAGDSELLGHARSERLGSTPTWRPQNWRRQSPSTTPGLTPKRTELMFQSGVAWSLMHMPFVLALLWCSLG